MRPPPSRRWGFPGWGWGGWGPGWGWGGWESQHVFHDPSHIGFCGVGFEQIELRQPGHEVVEHLEQFGIHNRQRADPTLASYMC